MKQETKQQENSLSAFEMQLKNLICETGEYESIKPDGNLEEKLILTYLIQRFPFILVEYDKIIKAFKNLKKSDAFISGLHSKQVSDKTLRSIELFEEALVRPIRSIENGEHWHIYVGEIIQLPSKNQQNYRDGEAWKMLIDKEKSRFKIGDKVLYNYKSDIVLDNELLHVVSNFSGRLVNELKVRN